MINQSQNESFKGTLIFLRVTIFLLLSTISCSFSYGQTSIIDSLVDHQKYSEAIQQLNNLLRNIEAKNGKINEEYVKLYSFRTYLLMQAGSNPNYVVNSYDTVLQLKGKLFGKYSFEYSKTLSDLASIQSENGRYRFADSLYLRCIEIRRKLLGDTSTQLVETLINYASLKNKTREYDKTFLWLEKVGKLLNDKPTELFLKVYYFKILSEAYDGINDQKNREINLLEAFAILQEEAETGDLDLYSSILVLNGLAQFYIETGNLVSAQKYYSLAIRCSKPLGRKNHYYQYAIINSARVYSQMGMKDTALSILTDELSYRPETAYDSASYFNLLHNMGAIYSSMKNYKKALEIYCVVKPFYEKQSNNDKTSVLLLYKDIAIAYEEMGNIDTAEHFYMRAVDIFSTLSEKEKMKSYNMLYDISIFYSFISKSCKSLFFLQYYINYQNKETNNFYYFLNQEDQLKYILNKDRVNNLIMSEISKVETCENSLQFAHEQIFNRDNLLLFNNTSIRKHLFNNQSRVIDSLLLRLNYLNKSYYFIATSNGLKEEKKEVERDIERVKKKIISISDYNPTNYAKPDCKKVSSNLKPNEAIIEFVYYSYFNHRWTDSVYYGAFVIRQNSPPQFVQLFERREIQMVFTRSSNREYSNYYNNLYSDSTSSLYNLIWRPLAPYLEGTNTLFISSAGYLHSINFSALPTDSKSVLLGEKYNIHALGAVADVIDFNSSYLNSTSVNQIVLFGGIDYDRAQKLPTTKSQRIDISSFQQISDLTSRGSVAKFGYLPGSLTEVKNIETMGRSNELNVVVNSGENATETAIKNLSGKKEKYFLHIATHGYFFPDVENKTIEDSTSLSGKNIFKRNADPLFRSGLIFSGANHTWGNSNYVADSSDDGILTSYEISNLDLSNCQLVVLSACETGLGDIKGSEGVFGLQRAFKMAGVKNIIMSLWRVPDKETQELMSLFYHYCFSGKSIHDALQAAQSEMKLRGYAPYYWAGFKLLQ